MVARLEAWPSVAGVFQRAGFSNIARLTAALEHYSLSGSYMLRFIVRRIRRESACKDAGKEGLTLQKEMHEG